jgi:hypothetical protein
MVASGHFDPRPHGEVTCSSARSPLGPTAFTNNQLEREIPRAHIYSKSR